MQPVSNTSLVPANAVPSTSNAAGRSGRSSPSHEQQQFSPILRTAIESTTNNNPQVHLQRSDKNSSLEGTDKPGRQVSGDKKPISSTSPIDLPTLLKAHALSMQALEIKSAAPVPNLVVDASSSGSKTSTATTDKTFNSQLQDVNHPPVATASGILTTIVSSVLQSNERSLSALSSGMVVTAPVQTSELHSAVAVSSGIFGASANVTAQGNELSLLSTKSNINSMPPLAVLQAGNTAVNVGTNGSVGSHTGSAVVASSSDQSVSSTLPLTSSAPQVGAKVSGDSPSRNAPIPPMPDLLGAFGNQSDSVLKLDKSSQQKTDGSSVSGSVLPQKANGSQSPSLATSTTVQNDPRFASLLSSVVQHPTIPLPTSDQKPSGTVQKDSSTPAPASSAPATAGDSSHTQDYSSASGEQNGPRSTATSAATDGTNQFSMNMHSAVAPKTDLVTQTMVAAPVSLLSTSNKTANPAASLPQTSSRSLETPQQATSTTNWGGGHFVTDARLIQTPALSEMRISMRSDQLGSVEVRAHSVGDEMGAAITVEKRDAHTALAIELPALQQSLTDKHINVARVVLTQGSLSSTTGDSHASPQQGERNPSATPFAAAYLNQDASAIGVMSSTLSVGPAVIFNSHGRLSVHA